jgi:hypothetical protein
MSSALVSAKKSELEGHYLSQPVPQETAREGVEVIRTFFSSSAARKVPKVVNGYAYRCIQCNGIWSHRMQAYRHDCPGITVLGL